jgi:hypothetical protein
LFWIYRSSRRTFCLWWWKALHANSEPVLMFCSKLSDMGCKPWHWLCNNGVTMFLLLPTILWSSLYEGCILISGVILACWCQANSQGHSQILHNQLTPSPNQCRIKQHRRLKITVIRNIQGNLPSKVRGWQCFFSRPLLFAVA